MTGEAGGLLPRLQANTGRKVPRMNTFMYWDENYSRTCCRWPGKLASYWHCRQQPPANRYSSWTPSRIRLKIIKNLFVTTLTNVWVACITTVTILERFCTFHEHLCEKNLKLSQVTWWAHSEYGSGLHHYYHGHQHLSAKIFFKKYFLQVYNYQICISNLV